METDAQERGRGLKRHSVGAPCHVPEGACTIAQPALPVHWAATDSCALCSAMRPTKGLKCFGDAYRPSNTQFY